jgi:hypothetical protein
MTLAEGRREFGAGGLQVVDKRGKKVGISM